MACGHGKALSRRVKEETGATERQMKRSPALLSTAGNEPREGQQNLRRQVGVVKPGVGS